MIVHYCSRSNYSATHNALLAVLSFLYGHTVHCSVYIMEFFVCSLSICSSFYIVKMTIVASLADFSLALHNAFGLQYIVLSG
jgi:hypothetical protein